MTDPAFPRRGKLILVTATTPTVSGEGKTVTSIGLVQGLERIGKKAIITSREPSLGPVFGMKGGAAGGGLSQVEPSQKINLHFHGDIHAMTSAHNLLAALIDAHLFHGNELDLDPERITWPRAMDMNDRALRRIAIDVDGKAMAPNRRTGFRDHRCIGNYGHPGARERSQRSSPSSCIHRHRVFALWKAGTSRRFTCYRRNDGAA